MLLDIISRVSESSVISPSFRFFLRHALFWFVFGATGCNSLSRVPFFADSRTFPLLLPSSFLDEN
jgi:hypothetical protein